MRRDQRWQVRSTAERRWVQPGEDTPPIRFQDSRIISSHSAISRSRGSRHMGTRGGQSEPAVNGVEPTNPRRS